MYALKILLIAAASSFLLSVAAGLLVVPLLKRLKAGQPVLKYVKEHKGKDGTPTMGGLFFIPSAAIVFFAFGGGSGRVAAVSLTIGAAFMAVGFLDDFLKIKLKRNEGLKAYQKIIFQTAISVLAGVFAYKNGIDVFFLPFIKKTVNAGLFAAPIIAFAFIALTNGVNLTDGLDGLAAGTSLIYLVFITALVAAESAAFPETLANREEYEKLMLLSACIIGASAGFLMFNVSPAKVFMGDTGSLSLGGFIGAISVFSFNTLFIPLLGIVFVLSVVSVIIQVAHYKRTKKRVFLMAPLHHHLQLKGFSETRVSYIYPAITCITGILSVIFYL